MSHSTGTCLINKALPNSKSFAVLFQSEHATMSAKRQLYNVTQVAILLMEYNSKKANIAYKSRAMTPTEMRYAQIEKEMLVIVHSCRKFHHYVITIGHYRQSSPNLSSGLP